MIKGLSHVHVKDEDHKPPKKVDTKLVKLPKMTFFTKPRKLNDCRICKELEAKGETDELYENHLGNYPTGCPRYIKMSTEERSEIAKAAKYCLKCHDPVYVYKSLSQALRDHKSCPMATKEKKSKFTCTVKNCNFHMWVCFKHKDQNQVELAKFGEDLKKKGHEFGFIVNLSSGCASEIENPEDPVKVAALAPQNKDVVQTIDDVKKSAKGSTIIDVPSPAIFMFGHVKG